ncbi:hypothetical protein [Pseudotenacibaculum haliotis]|uniref:Natural product n=1 Tax=Pseudotenacibaculum haliotis TaxID=1862138 RepID=A0ABW5LSQ3_9FLAO
MKKQILNFGETLSRAELQKINGGTGTCAYYNGETGQITYNLSSSQAQGMLANASDHWCCESCDTASWYHPDVGDKAPAIVIK